MPLDLLWVHKDAQSKRLSKSEKLEDVLIRRHVQQTGRPHAAWRRPTRSRRSRNPTTAQCESADLVEEAESIPQPIDPRTVVLTPTEKRSFGYFMHCATEDYWGGWRDAHFWQQLVPRIAHNSAPVMHSVLALSTFHEDSLARTQSSEAVAGTYSHFKQIGKAVSSAQKLGDERSLSQHLTTCIILCCVLQLNQHREAISFLRTATLMLQQCTSSSPQQLPAYETETIETLLRPVVGLLCNSFSFTTEATTAFMISVQRHRSSPTAEITAMPSIPTRFKTLGEAAHTLGRMLKWAHDTIPIDRQPGIWEPLRKLRTEWLRALDATVVSDSSYNESTNTRKLLRMTSIYGLIIVETFNSTDPSIYDNYHAQFTEFLDLATEVCALPNAHAWMFAKRIASLGGVDNGIIKMMAFVAGKVRDDVQRRRVLDLLYFSRRFERNSLAARTADDIQMLWRLPIRNLDDVQIRHYVDHNRRKVIVKGMRDTSEGMTMMRWSLSEPIAVEEDTLQCRFESDMTGEPDQYDDAEVPDTIYGVNYVEFLDDRERRTFTRLEPNTFVFPIPFI